MTPQPSADDRAPGVVPSPNIWSDPDTYELENQGVDPDGRIESAIRQLRDWTGRDVLEIGCGTGYHLPGLASARSVVGVEPHPPLLARARDRVAGLGLDGSIRLRSGSAASTGLEDDSVDLAIARWAYFFGPGCEPGLTELARVLRPGGFAVVVDVDAGASTFGSWFTRAWPDYDPAAVERFWRRQRWQRQRLTIRWGQPTPEQFRAVLALEFPPAVVQEVLAADPQTVEVDYAVAFRWRRFG